MYSFQNTKFLFRSKRKEKWNNDIQFFLLSAFLRVAPIYWENELQKYVTHRIIVPVSLASPRFLFGDSEITVQISAIQQCCLMLKRR